jgi:hypothetical protein
MRDCNHMGIFSRCYKLLLSHALRVGRKSDVKTMTMRLNYREWEWKPNMKKNKFSIKILCMYRGNERLTTEIHFLRLV